MYQALLTRRYLTTKIMPMLAALSVMACCAMLLTAWSIMGGFLVQVLKIGREMEADVSISWPTIGFGHYEELISDLQKEPLIKAAAPAIDVFGMLTLPDDRLVGVQVRGVDERYANVTGFRQSLWWRPITEPMPKDKNREDPRLEPGWGARFEKLLQREAEFDTLFIPPVTGSFPTWEQTFVDGLRLTKVDPVTKQERPAAVLGIELGGMSRRQPGGWYTPPVKVGTRRGDGAVAWQTGFMPARSVTLTVLPVSSKGRVNELNSRSVRLPVANEFRTGFYEADKNTMLVNLGILQDRLGMLGGEAVKVENLDPYAVEKSGGRETTPQPASVGITPARVTTVLVKGADGANVEAVREACVRVYEQFAKRHADVPSPEQMSDSRTITTWERRQATFLGAVKRETTIVVGMLLFISLVCVVLILAIFWAMVSEKTKDVGILRAVGCSKAGVAWVWLSYGLTIGVVGGALGTFAAWLLVTNINPIHDWLAARGQAIWDPNVYYLPEIPSTVDPVKAALVFGGAVVFATLGALVPALRAATMDPVKALRFE